MNDLRCRSCAKLLFRYFAQGKVEIKCERCKKLHQYQLIIQSTPSAKLE